MRRFSEGKIVLLMVAVFLVFGIWMVMRSGSRSETFPALSTRSPWPDGAQALFELSEECGINVERHYGSAFDYPEGGCMVAIAQQDTSIVTMLGMNLDMEAVAHWVEAGGTLVLFASTELTLVSRLYDALEGKEVDDDWYTAAYRDPWSEDVPAELVCTYSSNGQTGNRDAMARTYLPGERYELSLDRPVFWQDVEWLEIGHSGFGTIGEHQAQPLLAVDKLEPVILFSQHGEGELIWVARPELVANGWIDRADNHRLALALLAYAAKGRTVYFDERLHGYQHDEHNAGTLLFQTYGGRLLLLLGLAFIVVYLGQAIRPARYTPKPIPPRRQVSEMVLAQADLYQRANVRVTVTRSLVDGFKRYLVDTHLQPRILTHGELLAWLRKQEGRTGDLDSSLVGYLSAGRVPATANELLRLTRFLDFLRAFVDKQRHG